MWGFIASSFLISTTLDGDRKLIGFLVSIEFLLHEIIYLIGYDWLYLLDGASLYLAYIIAELFIMLMLVGLKASGSIAALIYLNIVMNVLYLTQFNKPVYDFIPYYYPVIGTIMSLEVMYLLWLNNAINNKVGLYGNKLKSRIFGLFDRSRILFTGRVQ